MPMIFYIMLIGTSCINSKKHLLTRLWDRVKRIARSHSESISHWLDTGHRGRNSLWGDVRNRCMVVCGGGRVKMGSWCNEWNSLKLSRWTERKSGWGAAIQMVTPLLYPTFFLGCVSRHLFSTTNRTKWLYGHETH